MMLEGKYNIYSALVIQDQFVSIELRTLHYGTHRLYTTKMQGEVLLNFNGGHPIALRVTSSETKQMPINSQRKRSQTQLWAKLFSLTTTSSRSITAPCSMLGALSTNRRRQEYISTMTLYPLISQQATACESLHPP